jgi:hypothetical protein
VRDDFSEKTKETLAKRVGMHCSNPQCRKLTSGPRADPTKALNIGVAAHVTAAAPGGARYDPSLSYRERHLAMSELREAAHFQTIVVCDKVSPFLTKSVDVRGSILF